MARYRFKFIVWGDAGILSRRCLQLFFLNEQLTNWAQLPRELREHKIDVPALFESTIGRRFGLPPALVHSLVPDREPRVAASVEGFRIRVAEPFIPQASIDFVNEALRTGSISSAGDWPQRLAQRLRDLFHYPVCESSLQLWQPNKL